MSRESLHDAIFKRAFSDPRAVTALVVPSLPKALVQRTDWANLRAAPTELVSAQLRQSQCDAVFEAPIRNEKGPTDRLVLLLHLEHQSSNDPSMVLRTLDYGGSLLLTHHRNSENSRARPRPPLLVPVVVAHDPKGWNAALTLDELYGFDEELCAATRAFRTQHSYALIDLGRLDNEAARERASDAFRFLVMVAMRESRKAEVFKQLAAIRDAINIVGQLPDGGDYFKVVACYIGEVSRNPEVTPQTVIHQLGLAGPAAKGAAAASWEKIQQELLARGKAEGIEEARVKARREACETLMGIAELRFGAISAQHKALIDSATVEELRAWVRAVGGGVVGSLDELFDAK